MSNNKPLVLIADDENNAVILLTRIFERDGFAVESARDGETALDKARALRPDLILMDVQMPKLNGFEVTAQLREDAITARIPVIFVTAAAREPSDVAHGLQLGADDYVRKPYNYHELLARAHSKMRARQLEDRIQRRNEELEALVRIGGEFNQRLALDELTDLVVIIARDELSAAYSELVLFNENEHPVVYASSDMSAKVPAEAGRLLQDEQSALGRAFIERQPLLINRTPHTSLPGEGQTLGDVMVTLLNHHGRLLGMLLVATYDERSFDKADLRLLRSIGEQAALAVRNAQLHASLQDYAHNLEGMVEARTEELRTAQDQLVRSEKLAALGRLAAGVAHEVNNPLQPILNCLEVAIEDIENNDPVDAEILRVAESEVQRIKIIVSRLLDFARPRTSEKSEIDLQKLVDEVLILSAKQLERMRVTLSRDFQPAQPIMADIAQIKQVVLNLVLNAAESMPEGGHVHVAVFEHGSGVNLIVEDTGTGMSEETIAQIFEPFYSTKGDGTGLGLAVSYGIVQGHGGNISVESQPGTGSRFTVWLPLRPQLPG